MFLLTGIGQDVQEGLDILPRYVLGSTVNHKFPMTPEDSGLPDFDV
jgi:hypothetical protein